MNKEELIYVLKTSIDCDAISEFLKLTKFDYYAPTQTYNIIIRKMAVNNDNKEFKSVQPEVSE